MVAVVLAAFAVVAFAALGMRGVSSATDPGSGDAQLAAEGGAEGAADGESPEKRPNVVLILTDDLDKSLMPYMPNTTRLIRDQGAAFTNFYVEQSSCCPSRASILSGLYAHNHGVIGNVWPEGGYDRWKQTKQDDDLPVWLSSGPATATRCSASTSTSTPTTRATTCPTRRRRGCGRSCHRAGSRGPRRCRETPTPRPTTG